MQVQQSRREEKENAVTPLVGIGKYDNALDCIDSSVVLDNLVTQDSTDNDWCGHKQPYASNRNLS